MNKEGAVTGQEEVIDTSMNDLDGDFIKVDKKFYQYSIGEYAIIIPMGMLWIVVTITVLGRMLFKSGGLAWSEEAGRMLLVCVAFLGLGIVNKLNMHFKVDKITGVPDKLYWWFDILGCLVEIAIMLILLIRGSELMWMTRNDITPALSWPVAVFYAPVSIGSIGMIYHSSVRLITILKGGQTNE